MCCEINDKNLPPDIKEAVRKIAEKQAILKPKIEIRENLKDKGSLGNLYFVSLTDATNNRTIKLIVKRAPYDPQHMVSDIINKTYLNEKSFYMELWPAFLNLQQMFLKGQFFDGIPKCYLATTTGEEPHKIVLDDLNEKNFHTLEKNNCFDKEHMELILKEYGKFHGLSFVLKHRFPKNFLELSQKFTNVFFEMKNVSLFTDSMKLIFKQCYDFFRNDTDDKLRSKLRKYVENGIELYFKSLQYNGNNCVFLHGDCWSNNILFEENSFGQPTDLRFIDFQHMTTGSPVYDLSYCLYSGGAADIFSELDYYLEVYYKSLSNTLLKFGLDVKSIYSLKTLKMEWKQYCNYGYCMALLLLKNKLKYDDAYGVELTEEVDFDLETFEKGKYDEEMLKIRVGDLVRHMLVNDFL